MYILDTNVVSELRKAKKANQNVKKWAQPLPAASLYISVISVLELEIGILLLERRDQGQGRILRAWMDRHVVPTFSGRILAIDTAVDQRCAMLHAPKRRARRDAVITARPPPRGRGVAGRHAGATEP